MSGRHARAIEASDEAIRSTATNALETKIATVHAGYYSDPILAKLPPPNRSIQPLIKRGTHARLCCIDRAIGAFCTLFEKKQILILGAGLDTAFLRMGHLSNTTWFEVDHAQIIAKKASMLKSFADSKLEQTPNAFKILGTTGNTDYLLEFDLREDPGILQDKLLQFTLFDPSLPTLVVSECVHMYIPVQSSKRILESLMSWLTRIYFVSYEPILKDDKFGHVMEGNLKAASMVDNESCLVKVRTLQDFLGHYKDSGCEQVVACDMWSAYETILSNEQRHRANRCEFLDEVEEWMMIMQHYCLLVARKDKDGPTGTGSEFCAVGKGSVLGFNNDKAVAFGVNTS